MTSADPLLSVAISVDYAGKPEVLRHAAFDMRRGEVLGLVGQSGSGKSTLALAILRLLSLRGGQARGEIRFQGRDLMTLSERQGRRCSSRTSPPSALDVITQAEVLELFSRLNRELGMSILYNSHDLLSIASLCHRVAILHEGGLVEYGETEQIFRRPVHEYTRRLVEALPKNPSAD